MNLGKQFKEGLITNNPVLVQVLGDRKSVV